MQICFRDSDNRARTYNRFFLFLHQTQQDRFGRRNFFVALCTDSVVVCLEQGADLLMAQLMLLPLTVSRFSKIQIGFTFLVPAHLGSRRKRAVKRMCVSVQFKAHLHGRRYLVWIQTFYHEWTLPICVPIK